MLVLTRRVGEEIVIASNIRVRVVMVKGQTIRLGITAPSSVPVVRLELLSESPEGAQPPTTEGPARCQERRCSSTDRAQRLRRRRLGSRQAVTGPPPGQCSPSSSSARAEA